MGVPVILTTECGSKQYIEPGKSGYVISPDDVDALITGVLDITSSRSHCMEMGAYRQEQCREALSSSSMIRSLINLYDSLLKR